MTKKNETIVTCVFVDIEDSTGISNYLEKDQYETFLLEFHKTIQGVLKQKEWRALTEEQNHKFMGDEFIAFFPHSKFGSDALDSALRLAAILKFQWYSSQFNRERLSGDKEHIELNIGINTGDLSLMQYPVLSGGQRKAKKFSYEGFPVTLAKRIQSIAEESQGSRIIVADRFFRDFTKVTHRNNEFHYIGKRAFKGIAHRFSCYEWIGGFFYDFLDFKKNLAKEDMLKSLYAKNPHNPWYATLLASYYFSLGEDEYYKGNIDNDFYKECAKVCISAIHNITQYNLREINELLFVCLEVAGNWRELCFRSEQAFANDQTFSSALTLNAKSLYMLGTKALEENEENGKRILKKAEETAQKVIVLFHHAFDHESLFMANLTLARYYSKADFKKPEALNYLKTAVKNARDGSIDWAYIEYDLAKKDFDNVKDVPDFKKEITKLKELRQD